MKVLDSIMRYGTLFKAQCGGLRWLYSEDEVSMASAFVLTWHASMINESLRQVEVPSGQGAAAHRRRRWNLSLRFELTAAPTVVTMRFTNPMMD
ncbi:hypothetical protein ABVT39_023345 [Epinephelus coioides]